MAQSLRDTLIVFEFSGKDVFPRFGFPNSPEFQTPLTDALLMRVEREQLGYQARYVEFIRIARDLEAKLAIVRSDLDHANEIIKTEQRRVQELSRYRNAEKELPVLQHFDNRLETVASEDYNTLHDWTVAKIAELDAQLSFLAAALNNAVRPDIHQRVINRAEEAEAKLVKAVSACAANFARAEKAEAERDALRKEKRERSHSDPITRLHNLCDNLADSLKESPYSAEAWDELTQERDALRADVKLLHTAICQATSIYSGGGDIPGANYILRNALVTYADAARAKEKP